ncbi:PLP-dependent aspartate aminotransferase family protein [bacterium]|nr:PLP-dependent aspartate aminotransferase family protein [bacterium]
MRRHNENDHHVAEFLYNHPRVEHVYYPVYLRIRPTTLL